MAWNCHAPHSRHAPLIVLRSWRILRSCGFTIQPAPKGFSAFIVIVSLYDCFSFLHFTLSRVLQFSQSGNWLLAAAAGKAQREFVVNCFSCAFHSLWQCVYMHFHWKSPEKKCKRTFACNFLQLLFVNEWQHERERERKRWRAEGRKRGRTSANKAKIRRKSREKLSLFAAIALFNSVRND